MQYAQLTGRPLMKINSKGFTLIEILISLAVSAIVLTAIYQTYHSQQKAYIVQEQVAVMQQNLRAAIFMISSELRMAGYDPSGTTDAGFVAGEWSAGSLHFTKDVDSNGAIDSADGSNEDITYFVDANRRLIRKETTDQVVAENIDALNLVYLQADGTTPATALEDIRAVEITLLVRSNRSETDYHNNFIYKNQQGDTIYTAGGDNVRRTLLTTQVKCRNLGL